MPPDSDWFKSLQVTGNYSPATVDDYFITVQKWLRDDMLHLRAPIVKWRKYSLWLRMFAFFAVASGVLLPLPIFGPLSDDVSGLDLGYLAVLIGGLILLFDQVFNVSNSWMRLTLSEMQVKQIRYRLDLEWAKRRAQLTDTNGAVEGPALIDILKSAADACHEIMEAQKLAWTNEVRQGMEALKGRLNADRIMLDRLRTERVQEQARPKTGAINFTIDKPADLKGPLIVKVGDEKLLNLDTVPARPSVSGIPAGLQTITLTADRGSGNGAQFIFMITEEILAGGIKNVAVAVA